jgi:hypothetical protein
MISTTDLTLIITLPILVLFLLALICFIIYKCYHKAMEQDRRPLLGLDMEYRSNGNSMKLNNFCTTETTTASTIQETSLSNVFDEARQKKMLALAQSREAAYLYMQFFVRSNPNRTFKSVDHLPPIGSQTDRNWFLINQSIKTISSETKQKLVCINSLDSKTDAKKLKLIDIAYSMSLSLQELEKLLSDLFLSIDHPYILSFDVTYFNFDKSNLLTIQNYSRDGSLRDYIYNTNPLDEWQEKYEKKLGRALPLKLIKVFGMSK